MIRVLLADDQPLIRLAYKTIIDSETDMSVVAEAATGRQAVDLATTARPDVVVMDIRMPELDGVAATHVIRANPDLAHLRVLVITTFELDEYVLGALRAGANGFLGKGLEASELLSAIRIVHNGDALLSPAATKSLIERHVNENDTGTGVDTGPTAQAMRALTRREKEILTLAGTGLSNSKIAETLTISEHTAKTHIKRIMSKLAAHDRAQLVVIAYETGLVRPSI